MSFPALRSPFFKNQQLAAGSPDVTVTPPVLSAVAALQTTIQISLQAPNVVTTTSSLQTPQMVATNLPNTLSPVASLISPTIVIVQDRTITPSVLTTIASLQSMVPIVLKDVSVQSAVSSLQAPVSSVVKAPSTLSIIASTQSPTVSLVTDILVTPSVFSAIVTLPSVEKLARIDLSSVNATSSLQTPSPSILKSISEFVVQPSIISPSMVLSKLFNVLSALAGLQSSTPIVIQDRLVAVAVMGVISSILETTYTSITQHPLEDPIVYDASMAEDAAIENELTDPDVEEGDITDPTEVAYSLAEDPVTPEIIPAD